MFVDTAQVKLSAGKGGNGAVSFRHEIYIPKGGPDGGDGGRGGSIIFRADKDTNTLLAFRYNPLLRAPDGRPGAGQRAAGRSGEDLIVEVPVGTIVWRLEDTKSSPIPENPAIPDPDSLEDRQQNPDKDNPTSSAVNPSQATPTRATPEHRPTPLRTKIADLTHHGQEAIIARGGAGGFGNAHFKSSTRQTPRIAEVGEPGESFTAELELKLLADIGLVGLPNAGKSTFLSVVTNARPEIANYPFTTLTPNLGVATIDGRDILIADIPGLIEGASEGKGLGHAFLRHVDRTAVLLHLVDAYNDDAGQAYATIRRELERYSDLTIDSKDVIANSGVNLVANSGTNPTANSRDANSAASSQDVNSTAKSETVNLAARPEIVALTKTEGLDPEIIALQTESILKVNPRAKIFPISAPAHQGLDPLLRALRDAVLSNKEEKSQAEAPLVSENNQKMSISGEISQNSLATPDQPIPTISLASSQSTSTRAPIKKSPTFKVTPLENNHFLVQGEKIEKFARRTDYNNYDSLNRLRDIMKKLGIRAELTTRGATPESIIEIAGHKFPLVEP